MSQHLIYKIVPIFPSLNCWLVILEVCLSVIISYSVAFYNPKCYFTTPSVILPTSVLLLTLIAMCYGVKSDMDYTQTFHCLAAARCHNYCPEVADKTQKFA